MIDRIDSLETLELREEGKRSEDKRRREDDREQQ
jgi:hypothetical protein